MKAYVRTWRYNIDTTLMFHGSFIDIDVPNRVLTVDAPVLESGNGMLTMLFLLDTDEITAERCEPNCECVTQLQAKVKDLEKDSAEVIDTVKATG